MRLIKVLLRYSITHVLLFVFSLVVINHFLIYQHFGIEKSQGNALRMTISLLGPFLFIYGSFWNIANNNFNNRKGLITDLANKSIDHLKEYKDCVLASHVQKMQILPKPSFWRMIDVFLYKTNTEELTDKKLKIEYSRIHRLIVKIDGRVIKDVYKNRQINWIKVYEYMDIEPYSVEMIKIYIDRMKKKGFVSSEVQEDIEKKLNGLNYLQIAHEIDKIFKKHKQIRPSIRNMMLHGIYLGYAQLQGVDLENTQLQGANLEYAQLQGANLHKVCLQGTTLIGAKFDGADIYKTNFQGANLNKAQFLEAFVKQHQTLSNKNIIVKPLKEIIFDKTLKQHLPNFKDAKNLDKAIFHTDPIENKKIIKRIYEIYS